MNCIFCKKVSDDSRTVEHIIPESLGNTKQILPAGIVCDQCNNYFARKVEKPFLDLEPIIFLRFKEGIPSKKKKIPPTNGILLPNTPVVLRKNTKGEFKGSIDVPTEAFERIRNQKESVLVFGSETPLPDGPIVSRFIGKIALEAFAQRLIGNSAGLNFLVNDPQLDPLRNHIREGNPVNWSIHMRRIYDGKKRWGNKDNSVQVIYEYEILLTDYDEMYFILSLFGLEFAINYGGPNVDGYIDWLKKRDNISPLYYGKNSSIDFTEL